jgi:copper chaperone NosL
MRVVVAALCVGAMACGGTARPVEIAIGQDACAHCRMTLVSTRTAAQIVSRSGEPVVFDDIGCLRDYLAATPAAPDARAFVADHRTGAWVDAAAAVFTRTAEPTPMASGLVAHADAASRDADPAARGGTPIRSPIGASGLEGRTTP